MTASLPLQFKQSLIPLLAAIPGVSAAYLDRVLPVGENELAAGPVIIVRQLGSPPGTPNRRPAEAGGISDAMGVVTHRLELQVNAYFPVAVLDNISEVSDELFIAINNVMIVQALQLPGHVGTKYEAPGTIYDVEGPCAVMRMHYDSYIATTGHDFSMAI